jgi:hypothetical protein
MVRRILGTDRANVRNMVLREGSRRGVLPWYVGRAPRFSSCDCLQACFMASRYGTLPFSSPYLRSLFLPTAIAA